MSFSFLLKKTQHNTSYITIQLIKELKVPVTSSAIIESLELHPAYPSLFSISDTLKKWKIDAMALTVEADKLSDLPLPFITQTKNGRNDFILVTSINGQNIGFKNNCRNERFISRQEFIEKWSNVVLLIESSKESGDRNYSSLKKKEQRQKLSIYFSALFCLTLLIIFPLIVPSISWQYMLFLGIKLIGLIITSLLLWYEIDQSNPIFKQICSAGKKVNCSAILDSKHSKFLNWLSWSEIGFYYFSAGFLSLLLSVGNSDSFYLFAGLNLLALPYILFSLFYQWRIVKQWCLLCLTVQGLLLLEFIVAFTGYWKTNEIIYNSDSLQIALFIAAACFFVSIFCWNIVKPAFKNALHAQQYKREINGIKQNTQIFNALLKEEKRINVSTEGLGIVIGNPQARNTIVKVCNPYCGPCAIAHSVIDEILESNDDIKLQIVFMVTNDENDYRAKPVTHLMALYEKNNPVLIREALDDWYGADKKDYAVFAAKYFLDGELPKQGEKLEAMNHWCNKMEISFTPTIFVNEYQLPNLYKIEDLKYLLI